MVLGPDDDWGDLDRGPQLSEVFTSFAALIAIAFVMLALFAIVWMVLGLLG